MPFNMQGMEWIILIIVALLVFGGSRIAGAGKNAGRAIREFKEETRAIKADEEAAKSAASNKVAQTTNEIVDAELIDPEGKPNTQV